MAAAAPAACKRRRMSARKTEEFAAVLQHQQQAREQSALLADIMKKLKEQPHLLMTVKALLDNANEGEETLLFPRGVQCMGGKGSTGVPNYVVVDCLATATGLDKKKFLNLPEWKEICRMLFLWSSGCQPSHPIPERRMAIKTFVKWFME
eukprot:8011087-Lingulodinium_polyedra.AAC.1